MNDSRHFTRENFELLFCSRTVISVLQFAALIVVNKRLNSVDLVGSGKETTFYYLLMSTFSYVTAEMFVCFVQRYFRVLCSIYTFLVTVNIDSARTFFSGRVEWFCYCCVFFCHFSWSEMKKRRGFYSTANVSFETFQALPYFKFRCFLSKYRKIVIYFSIHFLQTFQRFFSVNFNTR